jgi:hypothetical protein
LFGDDSHLKADFDGNGQERPSHMTEGEFPKWIRKVNDSRQGLREVEWRPKRP